jgi:hypothetical protein
VVIIGLGIITVLSVFAGGFGFFIGIVLCLILWGVVT